MARGLRENFDLLLAELPAFRKDLGTVVKAAGEQRPEMKDSLAQLLQSFDEAAAEVKQTMPGELADLEKTVDGLKQGTDELEREIADVERELAAVPPLPDVPAEPAPLPEGHGQTLRAELLERFVAPATLAVAAAGDVHDLTSGDWKHSVPAPKQSKDMPAKPAKDMPAKPGAAEQPRKEKPGHDVDDMNSQDWR